MSEQRSGGDSVTPQNENLGDRQSLSSAEAGLWDRLENIGSAASELLQALSPWPMHSPAVRSACTRLTLLLASDLEATFGRGRDHRG